MEGETEAAAVDPKVGVVESAHPPCTLLMASHDYNCVRSEGPYLLPLLTNLYHISHIILCSM